MKFLIEKLRLKSCEDMVAAIAAAPKGATILNLKWNELYLRSGEELAEAFAAVPSHIRKLILKGNGLGRCDTDDIVLALEAIPPHITVIDLSANDFEHLASGAFTQVLNAIPQSVTTVILKNNRLFRKSTFELIDALSKSWANEITFDLRNNALTMETVDQLKLLAATGIHTIFSDSEAVDRAMLSGISRASDVATERPDATYPSLGIGRWGHFSISASGRRHSLSDAASVSADDEVATFESLPPITGRV